MQKLIEIPLLHPSFPGHFPDKPIVPAALLLNEIAMHTNLLTGTAATTVRHFRLNAPIPPGATLTLQLATKDDTEWQFTCFRDEHPVASGKLSSPQSHTPTELQFKPPNRRLEAAPLYQHLPHAGSMRLIETLLAYDASELLCQSTPTSCNPLIEKGNLSSWAGLELAAQALACHAAALHTGAPGPGIALLATAKRMDCHVDAIPVSADQRVLVGIRLAAHNSSAASCQFSVFTPSQRYCSGQFSALYHS